MKSLKDAHERDKLLAQKVSDDLAAKRAHRAAASRRLALIDLLESLCSYPYLLPPFHNCDNRKATFIYRVVESCQ